MELLIARRSPDGSWSDKLPDWDGPSTLVQVFGPASMLDDPAPIKEIDRLYPTSVVVGCSGAGVAIDDEISDNELVVAVSRFESVRLTAAFNTVAESDEPSDIGREILAKLHAQDPNIGGMLVLSSGDIDGDALGAGFEPTEDINVAKFAGGLAGTTPADDGTFGSTWVLDANRHPTNAAMSVIGFSGGALTFRNAARGGWKTLGPERIATSADAYALHELDGRPALELYREYLGDEADELPAVASRFPLASRPLGGGVDDWAPTGISAIDEATNSLQLTRKIVEGSAVQMLRGYSRELFEAAEEAADDLQPIDNGPHLAVVTSCLGRRVSLGSRTADELGYVRQVLPDHVGMVGFYGMGEFSSTPSTPCKLYNYTMTLALIGEQVS